MLRDLRQRHSVTRKLKAGYVFLTRSCWVHPRHEVQGAVRQGRSVSATHRNESMRWTCETVGTPHVVHRRLDW